MNTDLTDDRIVEIFAKSKGSNGSQLIGFRLQRSDKLKGWVRASFDLDDRFANPMGSVQGGFLVAALDEVMTVALIVKSSLTIFAPSLDIKASYIKPVTPGLIEAEAHVVHLGRTVGFVEGTLFDESGEIAVRASACCLIRQRQR